ncbi:MAG: adenosylcobinamide-GDP ribazoletransferase [Alphaproteobacteria bacterium]|nr:adenosylcobinamide-GDP ribazoletransferase [Alphaproteobacteria bacterium]
MLLTRLPAGRIEGAPIAMGQTAWAWPLVGLLVGAIGGAVYWLASAIGLPPLLAASIAVGAMILATGGLHEDGLADVADGFGGGASPERRLEIMRDSRIGTYGVLALGLSLVIRIVAISEVGALAGGATVALIAIAMSSRAVMPGMLCALAPARPDGLGHGAAQVPVVTAVLSALFGVLGLALLGAGPALATLFAMVAGTLIVAWLARRLIGGQTGDVAGAAQQVAEAFGWLALVAVL